MPAPQVSPRCPPGPGLGRGVGAARGQHLPEDPVLSGQLGGSPCPGSWWCSHQTLALAPPDSQHGGQSLRGKVERVCLLPKTPGEGTWVPSVQLLCLLRPVPRWGSWQGGRCWEEGEGWGILHPAPGVQDREENAAEDTGDPERGPAQGDGVRGAASGL